MRFKVSKMKPVIIIAAHGSNDSESMNSLELIDQNIRAEFSQFEIRWALSNWIKEPLKEVRKTNLFKRGEPLLNLCELYQELRSQNKVNAVVQCLLVHEGTESDNVYALKTEGLNVQYGPPLLKTKQNVIKVAETISKYFGNQRELTIIIGHGSDYDERSNQPFLQMNQYVKTNYRHVYVTMMHGDPSPNQLFAQINTHNFEKVIFIPLLLAVGYHIKNDILGGNKASWKSRLNLPYKLAPSISETPEIMNLYFESIRKSLLKLAANHKSQ